MILAGVLDTGNVKDERAGKLIFFHDPFPFSGFRFRLKHIRVVTVEIDSDPCRIDLPESFQVFRSASADCDDALRLPDCVRQNGFDIKHPEKIILGFHVVLRQVMHDCDRKEAMKSRSSPVCRRKQQEIILFRRKTEREDQP